MVNDTKLIKTKLDTRNIINVTIGGHNLPNTSDYKSWGEILFETNDVLISAR
jgi:hypothetical protein